MSLERQRVVIIIEGTLECERLDTIVGEIDELLTQRHEVLLVSMGSIELGRSVLGIREPLSLAERQVCAAVGQDRLFGIIGESLAIRGRLATPIILSGRDLSDRERGLNIRIAINELLALRATPLIGYNPAATVPRRGAIRGLDQAMHLAVLIAAMVAADTIVFCLEDAVTAPHSVGSKFEGSIEDRAKNWCLQTLAALAGTRAVIRSGNMPLDLCRAIEAAHELPRGITIPTARFRGGSYNECVLVVGPATSRALRAEPSDLLTGSIRSVSGRFSARTAVMIRDAFGNEIARGIVNQSSETLQLTRGLPSVEANRLLRPGERPEVVLADEMVLFDDAA